MKSNSLQDVLNSIRKFASNNYIRESITIFNVIRQSISYYSWHHYLRIHIKKNQNIIREFIVNNFQCCQQRTHSKQLSMSSENSPQTMFHIVRESFWENLPKCYQRMHSKQYLMWSKNSPQPVFKMLFAKSLLTIRNTIKTFQTSIPSLILSDNLFHTILTVILLYSFLIHSSPMHPFSIPWKHQKTGIPHVLDRDLIKS